MTPPDGPLIAEFRPADSACDPRPSDQGVTWWESGGIPTQAPCYVQGTLIATSRGEVPVETIRPGDQLVTPHLGNTALQPVVWVGHRHLRRLHRRANVASLAPVRIMAGALADGVPQRDLCVSPDHAMFLDGRLVPAILLVNGTTIVQERHVTEVTYWHVELPEHGLLLAEGAPSESYLDHGNRAQYAKRGVMTLLKHMLTTRDAGGYDAAACFQPLRHGEALEAIRDRLTARAWGMRRRA